MQWYYAKDGSQHGPVAEAELLEMIRDGSVRASDLVWKDGMPEWKPVAQLPPLATAAISTPPPAAPDSPPPMGGSPYQPPVSSTPSYAGAPQPDIPTYLWQSIVVTVLCCLPFGIAAIIYAAKVDGLKRAGDWAGARSASDLAKKWCWWSFALGLAVNLLAFFGSFFSALESQ